MILYDYTQFKFIMWDGSSVGLLIYLGFYVTFNTVQVISRRVVGRAEENSSLGFCTVNCRPTASNYHLSHLRPCRESNPGLRGGRQECYHSATVAPEVQLETANENGLKIEFDIITMTTHPNLLLNCFNK